jgi:ABC-type tungstate transport system permease subunit
MTIQLKLAKKNKKVLEKEELDLYNIYSIISIEQQDNSQLIEVRKLIQTYMKEEIRKIQSTTEERKVLSPQVEKHRPVKSGSTKTSKPQTPK